MGIHFRIFRRIAAKITLPTNRDAILPSASIGSMMGTCGLVKNPQAQSTVNIGPSSTERRDNKPASSEPERAPRTSFEASLRSLQRSRFL